jgi:peptide-methionine (S)-S-oxide reductase
MVPSYYRRCWTSLAGSAFAIGIMAMQPASVGATTDTVVFAGGCYWGVESVFRHVNGVSKVVSGFAVPATGSLAWGPPSRLGTYAEAVTIEYDPARISYQQLLDIFFRVAHDPTEVGRQGPDVGPQYRSIVFVKDAAQAAAVKAYLGRLASARVYHKPITTELLTLGKFQPADNSQQDYARTHAGSAYVVAYDAPKLEQLKREFASAYRN